MWYLELELSSIPHNEVIEAKDSLEGSSSTRFGKHSTQFMLDWIQSNGTHNGNLTVSVSSISRTQFQPFTFNNVFQYLKLFVPGYFPIQLCYFAPPFNICQCFPKMQESLCIWWARLWNCSQCTQNIWQKRQPVTTAGNNPQCRTHKLWYSPSGVSWWWWMVWSLAVFCIPIVPTWSFYIGLPSWLNETQWGPSTKTCCTGHPCKQLLTSMNTQSVYGWKRQSCMWMGGEFCLNCRKTFSILSLESYCSGIIYSRTFPLYSPSLVYTIQTSRFHHQKNIQQDVGGRLVVSNAGFFSWNEKDCSSQVVHCNQVSKMMW